MSIPKPKSKPLSVQSNTPIVMATIRTAIVRTFRSLTGTGNPRITR